MSQAKVDKYKKEKKNRAKIMKRQRIKKYVTVFVVAVLLGGLLGIPIGKKAYKMSVEKANANRMVSALEYDTWFRHYWVENYSDLYAGAALATEGDAEAESDTVNEELDEENTPEGETSGDTTTSEESAE